MVDKVGREEVEVLEGDEGEPEIGRHSDVGYHILHTPLSELKQQPGPISVGPEVTVARAVETMQKRKVSALLVVDRKPPRRLLGIVTERDLIDRMFVRGLARMPVRKVMHRDPDTLRAKDPVAYAFDRMAVGRYRHVPIVDERGVAKGMVSARDLIDYVCELCPEETLNLPPRPELATPRKPDGE
jgi:CBS domain-containing protein